MMMALMYMTGRSSGYFNPGITLAAALCGRVERNDAITGITAQVFGALVAAALAAFMRESGGETVVAMHGNNRCRMEPCWPSFSAHLRWYMSF
jgi:glycerol uptake facilitator-like aquaporin